MFLRYTKLLIIYKINNCK